MLSTSRVEANIPAGDLARARDFYADKLGLTPVRDVMGVALVYETSSGTRFNIYETTFAGQAGHTIAQFHVDDLDAEVHDLQAKGVSFEVYYLPGVRWDGVIASIEGLGRSAWFRDSEDNILCVDQPEG